MVKNLKLLEDMLQMARQSQNMLQITRLWVHNQHLNTFANSLSIACDDATLQFPLPNVRSGNSVKELIEWSKTYLEPHTYDSHIFLTEIDKLIDSLEDNTSINTIDWIMNSFLKYHNSLYFFSSQWESAGYSCLPSGYTIIPDGLSTTTSASSSKSIAGSITGARSL